MNGTRPKRRRRSRVAALLLAAALVGAACGDSDDPEQSGQETPGATGGDAGDEPGFEGEPQAGGELTAIHVSNPSSLDPISGGSGNDHHSLYPFYDRLVDFDPQTLTPEPGLAESWEFPDPTTLVLTLQEGVTFHDGTSFDAEAVKYNLERALTLDTSTVRADLSMIESVEVLAPNQVQVNLNREDTSLVLILADRPGMMVSPTAAEAAGADFGRSPVGTGPFRFVEWLPNDRLVGEKNPDYWQDGLPYLDRLTIRYIADQQTGVNALQAGEADFAMEVSLIDVETLETNPDLEVSIAPSLGLHACYVNFSKPPFDSPQFREAVNLAIDREALNEAFLFGMAEPAHQVFPPGYWAHSDEAQGRYDHDPERAQELLAEAGYPDGVAIEAMAYDASSEARKNEIIQAQLAEVGIDMSFEVMEVGAATSTFFEGLAHDMYCAGWSGRPDPSQTALSLFGADAFYNAGGYDAPGMADALAAAGASGDIDERAEAFAEVTRIAQEESLLVPLVHTPDVNAYYSYVGGFQPNLYGKTDVSFLWVAR